MLVIKEVAGVKRRGISSERQGIEGKDWRPFGRSGQSRGGIEEVEGRVGRILVTGGGHIIAVSQFEGNVLLENIAAQS